MRYSLLVLLTWLVKSPLVACPSCNKELNERIYNDSFYPNLFITLSAFWVLAILVILLIVLTLKSYKKNLSVNQEVKAFTPVPLITASMILGIGLGGLIDGIVLHQILQWHEMFSNQIPTSDYIGKSVNMFWDGIFHAFCFLVILTGVVLLWKLLGRENINRSGKIFAGGLLTGWGLFNIVEGIIDHHILKLHNVVEVSMDHDSGNFIFLGMSVLIIIAGYLLIKNDRRKLKTFFFINHLNF